MGKKTKIGKQRKDVFYNLAKETGYRSRAAFKLIQLNRKFQFLEKTRICVDLCAAPGGWMQVAQQHMPVSSFIIGIDLDPIKPIRNCQSFKCDITTEECRQLLRKELKTWKADTFLNDGAPNVGKSWDYDAFMQNCLTLSALKLATEFLNKGGYFVTKIFRSKDYNALIWVLNKLFRKVHATKPKASRSESAEIFVVCEDYLAPDHIDQKFFQSNYLFKDILDVDEIRKAKKEFLKPVSNQKKIKATGYDDNLGILSVKLKVSEFVKSKNHLELLSRAHELVFDDKEYENDSLTTELIKDYCKDIKVLNRKEILDLLKWQKGLKKKYVKEEENEIEADNEDKVEEIDEIETEESKVDKFLKKKKKKVLKEKRKLIERMNLKMVHKDDNLVEEETGLFSLQQLQNNNLYNDFEKNQELIDEVSSIEFEDDDEEDKNLSKHEKKTLKRMKEFNLTYVDKEKRLNLDEFDTAALSSDEEERDEFGNALDENTKKRMNKVNVLSNKISDIKEKLSKKNKLHKNLNNDDDDEMALSYEDDDQDASSNEYDEQDDFTNDNSDSDISFESDNELILNSGNENKLSKAKMFFDQGLLKNTNFDDDVELDLFDPELNTKKKVDKKEVIEEKKAFNSDDSSDDSDDDEIKNKKPIKLDANGLALGTLMKKSDKTKRDIINEGWNRYSRGNEDLPSWFQKDEAKHFRKPISVPENLVKDYQAKLGNINIRTCKKVAEAKARKKRKASKIMEKLRKKTEAITENEQMVEKEKISNIKKLYRKVVKGQNQNNKPKLVVARKGRNNNRRPKGVKGRYKMVDARLKKDKRAEKKQTRLGKKQKVNKRLQKKPKLSKEEF